MLEADGLTGTVHVAGATAELQLFATGGSRATSRQRDEVEHRLRTWSDQLADYFGAMIDLYAHLDARPDRALPCLAHVIDKHEGMGETGPLSSEEETLVTRVKEAMELVSDALLVAEGDAYSLNELTRLVYDPFPARLTLAVDGPILRSEGFIVASDYLERPPVDAWRALIALEGRWVEPDLVTAMVAPAPENRQPDPDPSILATLPRSYFSPPTAADVESALLSELVPVEVHAVRWRQANPPSEERDEYDVNWLRVMADAEASVPD